MATTLNMALKIQSVRCSSWNLVGLLDYYLELDDITVIVDKGSIHVGNVT
jgi:hypothetical protein